MHQLQEKSREWGPFSQLSHWVVVGSIWNLHMPIPSRDQQFNCLRFRASLKPPPNRYRTVRACVEVMRGFLFDHSYCAIFLAKRSVLRVCRPCSPRISLLKYSLLCCVRDEETYLYLRRSDYHKFVAVYGFRYLSSTSKTISWVKSKSN